MTNRSRNQALLRFIVLPMIFLTVALLGGLRVKAEADHAFVFVAPPLITLILAVLLMLLFVRGHLVEIREWVRSDYPLLVNISHVLTLIAIFFASAQSFNSVLPEGGLLFWLFSFFFLWTLWNNQFSAFDAHRLLRSLTVLFGTAFVLKHMLLASLYAPEGSWLRRLAGAVLEGVALGTLDVQRFAPATGYISFFTLALYVTGLILLTPRMEKEADEHALQVVRAYRELDERERTQVREAIRADGADEEKAIPLLPASVEKEGSEEETVVSQKPEKQL